MKHVLETGANYAPKQEIVYRDIHRYTYRDLYTMQHAEDEVVLVYKDFIPLMEKLANKLGTVKHYVVMTDDKMPETNLTDLEYEELIKNAGRDYEFPDFSENTMATLSYTTGTTGRPKGVWFTHRKLVLHALCGCIAMCGLRSPLRLKDDREVYMPPHSALPRPWMGNTHHDVAPWVQACLSGKIRTADDSKAHSY
jgi:long-subunit acyl-CoA synthetase (AMP-forming)